MNGCDSSSVIDAHPKAVSLISAPKRLPQLPSTAHAQDICEDGQVPKQGTEETFNVRHPEPSLLIH